MNTRNQSGQKKNWHSQNKISTDQKQNHEKI